MLQQDYLQINHETGLSLTPENAPAQDQLASASDIIEPLAKYLAGDAGATKT